MKLLLDTCTFLWITLDAPELSKRCRELYLDPENEVHFSAVSAWEIAIKNQLGRLPLPEPPERFVPIQREKHGIAALPLDEISALHARRLPPLHQDPFDRMLVCQAIVNGMTILTPDEHISRYPVLTEW
ncbi:MAG: type II toxin-antitoxin system VapC family toxin [Deltaproteobacteria bacterium]|nr:type II toxin-antitoxin system VapC family toxin [Deltaproteobacteria bacterium]